MNHNKELLRGLWVESRSPALGSQMHFEAHAPSPALTRMTAFLSILRGSGIVN